MLVVESGWVKSKDDREEKRGDKRGGASGLCAAGVEDLVCGLGGVPGDLLGGIPASEEVDGFVGEFGGVQGEGGLAEVEEGDHESCHRNGPKERAVGVGRSSSVEDVGKG